MTKFAYIVVLAAALTACSLVPVPVTVDLGARLGENAQGSFTTELAASAAQTIDVMLPSESGQVLAFDEQSLPATVEYAEVDYTIALDYQGPALTGALTAALYLAPATTEPLWQETYLLESAAFDLNQTETTLTGTAVLNEAQIEAVNAGVLRAGVRISGQNVGVQEPGGSATFSYRVDQLILRAGVSVF